MPQEKPKKSVAVRDSIPLSTTPNPVKGSSLGAWTGPAAPIPAAVGASRLGTRSKKTK